MQVGDRVRVYYGCEWFETTVEFDEGRISEIRTEIVVVDFLDWVSVWPRTALYLVHLPYGGSVFVSRQPGRIVYDYRA